MCLEYGDFVELTARLRGANPGLGKRDAAKAVIALCGGTEYASRPAGGGLWWVKLDDGRELKLVLPPELEERRD